MFLNKQSILENLIDNLPHLLEISHSGVFTKSNGSNVRCEKFKAKSYGDFLFNIRVISMKRFESREEFYEAVVPTNRRDSTTNINEHAIISIEDAIKLLNVKIECNMSYYLNNRDELEKDLKRQVSEDELSTASCKIEQELFFNLMCKLFGSERKDGDERSFMLKEFRVITRDGNYAVATAIRDDNYVILTYIY